MTIRTRLLWVGFLCMHLPLILLVVIAARTGLGNSTQVLLAALLVTLLGAALLLSTITQALRPLADIERALRDHATTDRATHLTVRGHDEISRLSYQVNTITAMLSAERQSLQLEASTDHLTGLLNRRMAMKYLHRCAVEAKNPWLVIGDADHFKEINDRFGHANGDEVLVGIAHALRSSLPEDALIARWGGEEFVVMIDGCHDITVLLNSVQITLRDNLKHYGPPTISFGVTRLEQDVELALRQADEALYCAKQAGRARVQFSSALTPRSHG